jgi:hypothetical protein
MLDAYETDGGEAPAWSFIRRLDGRDKVEAIALVKLLEEQGSLLRRPQSGALGDGLFELRGKQVRLFYVFLPGRVIVLLSGEIKRRDDIPARTLARMRLWRGGGRRGRRSGSEPVKKTGPWRIDDELRLTAPHACTRGSCRDEAEQQIVALVKRGRQRQVGHEPALRRAESGRMKNLGVKTLVKCARALGASVSIRLDPLRRSAPIAGSRLRKAG